MNLKIAITTQERGLKIITLYSDLEAANIAYRNLCTERNTGRYEGILLIEIVRVNNV